MKITDTFEGQELFIGRETVQFHGVRIKLDVHLEEVLEQEKTQGFGGHGRYYDCLNTQNLPTRVSISKSYHTGMISIAIYETFNHHSGSTSINTQEVEFE